MEKKSQDVAKVQSFNCEKLGHFVKDYKKVNQDWAQGGFVPKARVAKLGSNLILLKFKIKIYGVLCLFDLGATHSFVSPNAIIQLGWVAKKVAKPIKVHLAQQVAIPVSEMVLGAVLECDKVKFAENFMVCT
jgi:hypothetical protein